MLIAYTIITPVYSGFAALDIRSIDRFVSKISETINDFKIFALVHF